VADAYVDVILEISRCSRQKPLMTDDPIGGGAIKY
jgi:hypothetical protein